MCKLREWLRADGHRLLEGKAVAQAATTVEQVQVDLVITDLQPNDVAKGSLVPRLRLLDGLRDVPILVHVQDASQELIASAIKNGADNFLFKPPHILLNRAKARANCEWRKLLLSSRLTSVGWSN